MHDKQRKNYVLLVADFSAFNPCLCHMRKNFQYCLVKCQQYPAIVIIDTRAIVVSVMDDGISCLEYTPGCMAHKRY